MSRQVAVEQEGTQSRNKYKFQCLTSVLLSPDIPYPTFANSVDPDQLASEEAN